MALSIEHRMKISLSMIGKKRDRSVVQKVSEKNTGKKRSAATKILQSKAARRRWSNPDQRLHASLKKRGSLNPNWNPDRKSLTEKQLFIDKVRGDLKKVKRNIFSPSSHSMVVPELGYSAEDLMKKMEEMFDEGMSWKNWGEWHMDHIRPVSSFPIGTSSFVINALENLQPLWKLENISKGSRFDVTSMENL